MSAVLLRPGAFLRREPIGGALLLAATVLALIWANSPVSSAYFALRDTTFGPASLHLNLTVGQWAADGLLALFFFVVGLELKQEFVTGELRDPRRALVPVLAAVGGVIVPAGVYLAVIGTAGATDAAHGWAVPTATDIAFVLAVLAVVGRGLPPAVRTFLLTLAVVDDLIAISVIALAYTAHLAALPLLAALAPIAAFAIVARRWPSAWWALLPLGLLAWGLIHASGIHATVAGVLLGLVVPARDTAPRMAHTLQPLSAGLAVPLFAFFSAGVAISGETSPVNTISVAVAGGLVLGKTVGVIGVTWLATRLPGARLDPSLRWADVAALAPLTGVGFTVALLVGDLAFGGGSIADDQVKIGILGGSLLAAMTGGCLLLSRARKHTARHAQQPSGS